MTSISATPAPVTSPQTPLFVPTIKCLTLLSGVSRLLEEPSHPSEIPGRWVVAVDGPPGCGKTTAVTELLAQWPGPKTRIELETSGTHKDVIERLYRGVMNYEGSLAGMRRSDMSLALRTALAGEGFLVVVDEAQKGGLAALEMLRQIHQDPTARWALVLSGTGIINKLTKEKMLDSRVALRIHFDPLTHPELEKVLSKLHPMFQRMPRDLIDSTDVICGGVLREWVKLLHWLTRILPEGATPTRQHVEQALSTITGRPVRLR